MISPCHKEIVQLHLFFENWFTGRAARENLSRLSESLHPEFIWISPWGTMHSKDELIKRVTPVYGSRPDMKIEIRNIKETRLSDTRSLAHYEEWQRHEDGNMGRITTAIFVADDSAPNGIAWFHIQETMLPNPAIE